MADRIKHARAISPWIIPNKGGSADDFHGLTDLGGDPSVGSEPVYVMGKKVKCGTDTETPVVSVPLSMLERGEIDSYLTLANLDTEPDGGFDLDDFNSSLVDVVYYIKDAYAGNMDSSMWFPKCAINSITLNIDDPQAKIKREYDLSTDDRRVLTGVNKCLIHVEDTAPSGVDGNYVIDISDPAPIVDPNNAGVYVLRIDRTRSGTTSSLVITTDYTYNVGTAEITVLAGLTGDVFNVYYSATTFGTPTDPTSVDVDSICFLKAENVTVLISDGTTEVEMTELSSLSLTATMNRIDENVIGNDERILREISDTPVTLDFSGRVDDYKGEQAFMNQLDETPLISSVKAFATNIKVTVKIYDSAEKSGNILIGYQVDSLSYENGSFACTSNEFATMDVSCKTDDILITGTEGNL